MGERGIDNREGRLEIELIWGPSRFRELSGCGSLAE
jgi:hypothetical protein